MKVHLISKGKNKALVVVHEQRADGKNISSTRHLKLLGGIWTDSKGNRYSLDEQAKA